MIQTGSSIIVYSINANKFDCCLKSSTASSTEAVWVLEGVTRFLELKSS